MKARLFTLFAAAMLPVAAFAQVNVINWNNTGIVAANANLDRSLAASDGNFVAGGATDRQWYLAFQETNIAANIAGAPHAVYAGYVRWQYDSTSLTAISTVSQLFNNDTNGDALRFNVNITAASHTGSTHAFIAFPKSTFLNDYATNPLDLTSGASFSGLLNVSGGLQGEARWAIKVNGTYYLSQTSVALTNGDNTLAAFDPSTSLWAAYNPLGSSVALNFNQSAATFLSAALTDIEAVGLYAEREWTATSVGQSQFQLHQFVLTATPNVIPEPSTYALWLGAVAFGLLAHRRRRASRA